MYNFVDKNSQFGQTPFPKIGRKTPDISTDRYVVENMFSVSYTI